MKKLLLLISAYCIGFFLWRKEKRGIYTSVYNRGCGYYKLHDFEEREMESGKTGIFTLLDYKYFSDPNDMIENARYGFIGYKGVKTIRDCSFREFIDLYYC